MTHESYLCEDREYCIKETNGAICGECKGVVCDECFTEWNESHRMCQYVTRRAASPHPGTSSCTKCKPLCRSCKLGARLSTRAFHDSALDGQEEED